MSLPATFYQPGLHASGVYAITCVTSGKVYVGSAVDLFHRWRGHYHHLKAGTHHCKHLQRAWRKYGANEFTFAVEETCPPDQLRTREQFHIDAIPEKLRYNSSPTAGSVLGFKMSPETIEKLRNKALGFRHSEETKRKLSEARKGIPTGRSGWRMTEEQRQKLSAAKKGKPLSPDHARKCSECLKRGRERMKAQGRTAAHRENQSKARRVLFDEQLTEVKARYLAGETMTRIGADLGISRTVVRRGIRGKNLYDNSGGIVGRVKRPLSQEHREKLSAATRGKPKSPEARANIVAALQARWADVLPKMIAAARRPEAREARRLRMLGNHNTLGRKMSEEEKRRWKLAMAHTGFGKPWSEVSRAKAAAKKAGREQCSTTLT